MMHFFTLVACLLALLSFLAVPAAAVGDLAKLLQQTDTVVNYDWEWVLIRINSLAGSLGGADWFSEADAQVTIKAVDAIEPEVEFEKPLSTYESIIEKNTDKPQWFDIGMVAYQRGTASRLELVLKDKDAFGAFDDELMKTTIEVPDAHDRWVNYYPNETHYSLNISLWKTTIPVQTEEEQTGMDMVEKLFYLRDGSRASLVYRTDPLNNKAVLYFPGRGDTFAHPNVLEMYQNLGYDVFSLDPRYCGRTRRFLNEENFRYAHSIDDFDKYNEEIGLSLEFIHTQKNYTKLFSMAHSTGAPLVLNYVMSEQEEPFDGYIFNGPFMDWGRHPFWQELLLENSQPLKWAGVDHLVSATGLSEFTSKLWILNRFNTTWRPLIAINVAQEWAQAVTKVLDRILDTPKDDPITSKPLLLLVSLGDDVVEGEESKERMAHVAAQYSKVCLTYNSHDVTYSRTRELNDNAIAAMSAWLENPEPTHFSTAQARLRGTTQLRRSLLDGRLISWEEEQDMEGFQGDYD